MRNSTKQYLARQLRHLPHEGFVALFLDNQRRISVYEELFQGSINSAAVYPRDVLRRLLDHNAAAVIFAHNHPSGAVQPSHADRQFTERLSQALTHRRAGVRSLHRGRYNGVFVC